MLNPKFSIVKLKIVWFTMDDMNIEFQFTSYEKEILVKEIQ